MEEALDILAFAPHPDDVELGCGGSLIAAADKGWRVAVADLTAGELSSRGNPEQRVRETERATELLGLTARFCLGLPDGGIGTHPDHRLPIIDVVRQTRPRIVLAPYWEDRHPDHYRSSSLVREACFFAGVGKIGDGVPYRPPLLYYYLLHTPFSPSFIMDVSAVWERRMAAVRAYESQFMPGQQSAATALSRPGFLRALEARAAWFGWMIGATYGEPFLAATPMAVGSMPGLPPRDGFPGVSTTVAICLCAGRREPNPPCPPYQGGWLKALSLPSGAPKAPLTRGVGGFAAFPRQTCEARRLYLDAYRAMAQHRRPCVPDSPFAWRSRCRPD